ncbi:ATP-dependent DNA helicase MER3 [Saxophila tyrrhenica]|uniref:DNA 3'-5' helicase n=1 Tax=Saxophila tyrrhenica TaxID=1690608 RepID=A0AAV9PLW6_9PEZI|nr:ATP-dependent DNA helicase MER3 [Saxophila tyrrhenica]
MDESIFNNLDRLERADRAATRPTRDVYNNSSTEYSAYDGPSMAYDGPASHRTNRPLEGYDLDEAPMTLDSFDEQLLRQPDYNSRQGQAALGRARLSLPPAAHARTQDYAPVRRGLDLSRFALDQSQHGPSTSSPMEPVLPSSPSFRASQRQPAPVEHGRLNRSHQRRKLLEAEYDEVGYEPFTAEQLDAEESYMMPPAPEIGFRPNYAEPQQNRPPRQSSRQGPVVQGINLVSTHALPDRLRAIFPYPLFNAVQSKTFDTIFNTNANFVLSAPTGSGKTAVLELAVCRLISTYATDSFKIVYQAPTKSLCAERQRDWQAKFGTLGLECAELTGDTDTSHLRNVQQASIIITTPEKWDSMTRKWKDHQRLMQMVKLFLIDEVHILKEDRGATLEAVVSRMKSVGSDVRFVALSATVPNSDDIAAWLGGDPMNPHTPAMRERFGEDFRPVRLKKHVCGYPSTSNDFAFEKSLSAKLPEVISKWSQRKPIMVFCFTRAACGETAKMLASWWSTNSPKDRYWSSPRKRIVVGDKDLQDTISSGVAFHHAGLSMDDRNAVERGYLEGEVNVICCTSTLAVGVNLPCHMVIIKNTVTYQGPAAGGCKEYSDLEIMQMLGRAGRPQFDDSAVAVIMTRQQRASHYEKMISGEEILESCLHRNLIDHLNAEIGLGTISSASSARKWLSSTFLYIRLKDNPEHYKIDGDGSNRNLEDRLEKICSNGIAALEEYDLVRVAPRLRCTEFGDAMARYYLQFDTMKVIMALPAKANISEILSAVAQAAEFKEVRFRSGEKPIYKDLNKNTSIKFPIPMTLDLPAHKISLIIQSVLGAIELPTEDYKHTLEYNTAKASIFQHATRIIRCIVDCQLYLEDVVTTRNGLMLARSIGAQVWDDSPLHMKQLEGIGLVSVRKLANAGIMSVEELENTEAHHIERALSRNPPYGQTVQAKAKAFPKLRISIKMVGEPHVKKGEHVAIKIKTEIGFLNETVPDFFQRKPVYICLLAETSDGHKVHFARISAKKLSKGQDVLFEAHLTDPKQSIRAYVMCDEIAGTMRHAVLTPNILALSFPARKMDKDAEQRKAADAIAPNTAKRRLPAETKRGVQDDDDEDEFADPDLNDTDFAVAEAGSFMDIDAFDDAPSKGPKPKKRKTTDTPATDENFEPQRLPNGKWACKHACKNKNTCKHMCCRDGLDSKPKPPKPKGEKKDASDAPDPKQTQLKMSVAKKAGPSTQPGQSNSKVPATQSQASVRPKAKANDSMEARDLDRLHNSIKSKTPAVPTLASRQSGASASAPQQKAGKARLSFVEAARHAEDDDMSDYGNESWTSNDLPDVSSLAPTQLGARNGVSDGNDLKMSGAGDRSTMGEGDVSEPLAGGDDVDAAADFDFDFLTNDYSFEDSDGWRDEPSPDDQSTRDNQDATSKPTVLPRTSNAIFVGDSSDSVANALPTVKSGDAKQRTTDAAQDKSSDSVTFGRHKTSQNEVMYQGYPGQVAGADRGVAHQTEPPAADKEADDALAWFKEKIGGEDIFNFVD